MFRLTRVESESAVWVKLREHLKSRLHALRVQNDAPADAEATAALRGRIAEIKALLAAEEPLPDMDRSSGNG